MNELIALPTMSSRSRWRAIRPSTFVSGSSTWPMKSHGPAAMKPSASTPSRVPGKSTSPAICSWTRSRSSGTGGRMGQGSQLEKDPPAVEPVEHRPGGAGEEYVLEDREPGGAERLLEPGDPAAAEAAEPAAERVAQHIGGDGVHADHDEGPRPRLPPRR